MTTKELIERLQKMPQDETVRMQFNDPKYGVVEHDVDAVMEDEGTIRLIRIYEDSL